MGHSIPLMIRHDGLNQICLDKNFYAKLFQAVQRAWRSGKMVEVNVGKCANLIQVLPMPHSDEVRYYKVHGDLMKEVKVVDGRIEED